MQVSVEAPSAIERRLTIVVPIEQVDKAFEESIAQFAKNAKIKGFRPGKVPLPIVKQQYGDAARQEALSKVIQSSLYAAINQEKLSPVDVPRVEPKTIAPGQPLEYVAMFEVLPEVDTVKFDVKNLEKQIATITEADIKQVVDRLREQSTKWNKVERPAQEKDQVIIDFRGSIDGKAFQGGEAHDYPIVIGSKTMIPGFEEGLLGTKKGEEKIIKVTFPENYHAKEFAGKTAEFAIQVHQVSEPEIAAMDEAFIKRLGVKSGKADDLHAEIKKNLERELDRVIKTKLKAQVFNKLVEQNPLEVPKSLIEREAKRIHDEVHPHHGHEHKHTADEMAVFEEAAKRNVALGLLVGALAKQNAITPDAKRVQAHLANIASVYEKPSEITQWYSQDKRRLAELEMYILEEQVLEKLLEKVAVTEKMLSYNELIAQQG